MEFETKIYPQIGGYGRYNRIITLFSWFPNFAVSLNLFSDVFFTLIPESYHCKPDLALLPPSSLLGNLSRQASLNLTIPWLKGSGFSHCELYKYPENISNYTENVPRDVVQCTKGWEYGKPAGLQNNLVTEVSMLTGVLGRRCALLLSVVLSGLLGIMSCLSNSPSAFPFLRLCQGSTLAGVFLSSYIARLEWCDPPHRLMVSMVSGFFALFAELLLPGFAVLCRDWPVLQAVATLPLLLLLSYWCCASVFPESPRWLMATSQIPQAKKCLQSFSARNGVCVSDELYPAETLLSEIDEVFPEDIQPEYHHVVELRHTRVIWKNCLILGFTLFIGTGIQYCFTRNLHIYSPHFYFSYFLRVLTGALACIFLCVSVDRFGRRGMLLLAAIVTGLSSLLLLALTQYLHGGLVLVLSVVGLLSSQALAMLSVFFGSEVMPTVVRGGTLGLIMAAGCVGMAASSLMELQNNGGYFLHHVIFASFAVLSVLCIMLLPESKHKPLPDSLKDGERQRRPPLFLSRMNLDNPPLLRTQPHSSEYNRDNYSRLVTATKKMLAKDALPYKISILPQAPLLASNGTAPDANDDSS
ncbi:putative solute carrier family 22 member 31 [Sinocyclocheilus grahami]|nr:PREDICTED: putative solute carrier family 22 member 31 [Sinocyclocheilus grahami]